MTRTRDIIIQMALRGFLLSPALGPQPNRASWFDAPRLGIVLALLGNLAALALWPQARTAPRLPWVELVFAALLILFASPALFTSAYSQAKRGFWGAEFLALVAAFAALVIGISSFLLAPEATPLTPNFLLRLGARHDGPLCIAFESAGAIVGCGFLAHQIHRSAARKAFAEIERTQRVRHARVRRILPQGAEVVVPCVSLEVGDRVRLVAGEMALVDLQLDGAARVTSMSGRLDDRLAGQIVFRGERLVSIVATGRVEHIPPNDVSLAADTEVLREAQRIEEGLSQRTSGHVENVLALALTFAGAWFAAFAVIVHVIIGRHALHPGLTLASVAVLCGASSAAFVCGLPLARLVAITRARSFGIVVKNIAAFESLASIDCVFFDLSRQVFLDIQPTCRALWHRSIGCRLLSSDDPDVSLTLGHRFGVAASAHLSPEDKALLIHGARTRGAQVLHVARPDTAQMIPADVSVAVASDARADVISVPLIVCDSSLKSVVWLIDTARQLRSRKVLLVALTLVYDAIVIPLCVAGFVAPMVASTLALGLTFVNCALASSVGTTAGRKVRQDKHVPAQTSGFSSNSRGSRQ